MSPQLLGSAALSVARVAPPRGPRMRFLLAAALEGDLLLLLLLLLLVDVQD